MLNSEDQEDPLPDMRHEGARDEDQKRTHRPMRPRLWLAHRIGRRAHQGQLTLRRLSQVNRGPYGPRGSGSPMLFYLNPYRVLVCFSELLTYLHTYLIFPPIPEFVGLFLERSDDRHAARSAAGSLDPHDGAEQRPGRRHRRPGRHRPVIGRIDIFNAAIGNDLTDGLGRGD